MDWPFVPGLGLSEALYQNGIEPIFQAHDPTLDYAVARLDHGSDVLGFDTPTSMDHGWGPRATVFLKEKEFESRAGELGRLLANELPVEVCGVPTNFESPQLIDGGLSRIARPPVQHGVVFSTIGRFFTEYLGFDPRGEIHLTDWLTVPSQRLRTVASGMVFRDPDGLLGSLREKLHWYPEQLWLYLMASQWRRIGQEESFMGRAGALHDDLGFRLIAGRLVWNLMRLSFLQERQHAPYSKWIGKAFAQLSVGHTLGPALNGALSAGTWEACEAHLAKAYGILAECHNALGLTPPLDPMVRQFYGRPIQIIDADRFAEALEAQVTSGPVRALPSGVGAVWQLADTVDVLDNIQRCRAFAPIVGPSMPT